ncbi:MAG: hypothetical protein GY847_04905 [Proteobacteria bacterium]|nr:hypothetical protein [Pseudomonadota bacterium]
MDNHKSRLDLLLTKLAFDDVEKPSVPTKETYSFQEVCNLLDSIYGKYLARAINGEIERASQQQTFDDYDEEHERSIALLFQNEVHKYELEEEHDRSIALLFENEVQKCELETLNVKLFEANKLVYKAGMADMSTDILHNLGNILSSISVSIEMIKTNVHTIVKRNNVDRINKLLTENMNLVENDNSDNSRVLQLVHNYKRNIYKILKNNKDILKHIHRIEEKMRTVIKTIFALQNYAERTEDIVEEVDLERIIEDALAINSAALSQLNISINRIYPREKTRVCINEIKLIQVLTNIIANSEDAMRGIADRKRELTVSITKETDTNFGRLTITDNGIGISAEHIEKIFVHGFTTKEGNNGFGLHNCANYTKEMGGIIRADSSGKDKGATIILRFPLVTTPGNIR